MTTQVPVAVGRQGIHDADGLIGYELLFRPVAVTRGGRMGGDAMTAAVIVGAMTIGLDQLVGPHKIFVNAEYGVLARELPIMLPPERTVIEVVDGVEVDDRVLAGCAELRAEGYTLALDHTVWGTDREKLLDLVSIVKIDLMTSAPKNLPAIVDSFRDSGVTLLAERVMDPDAIPALRELGIELFQGFALDRPVIVPGRTLAPSAWTSLTRAVETLDNADFEALEEILRRDPALTQQVIGLASVGRPGELRRTVNTIRDALVVAGTVRIKNWLSLLTMQSASLATSSDSLVLTLQRARACEELAAGLDATDRSIAFAAGMLSALDILLGVDKQTVAGSLPIGESLRDAAFGADGALAAIVRAVTQRQQGAEITGFDPAVVDGALGVGFDWAIESSQAMLRPGVLAGR